MQTDLGSPGKESSAKKASPRGINHSVTRRISVTASVEPGESRVVYALKGRRDRLREMRRNRYGRLIMSCSSAGIPATTWIVAALAPDEEVKVEGRGESAGGQVLPGEHVDGAADRGGVEFWSVDAGRQSEEYHLTGRIAVLAANNSRRSCAFNFRGKVIGIVR
jgi:hypothetical protein